jgi:hypothetical protein
MRKAIARRLRIPVLAACAAALALGFAQDALCSTYIWMTPQYSTYTNYSSDGTYIYTSVQVDGYTSGTCPTSPAYLANECHGAQHTPKAYNTIGSVGGWESGSAQYWANYLSMTNYQQIAATPGTEYTFSGEGAVICSVVGQIYSSSYDIYLKLVDTTVKLVHDWGNGDCEVEPDCIAGQTPTCTSAYVADGSPCKSSWNCWYLAYSSSSGGPWTCLVAGECNGPTTLPGPCD